MEEGFDFPVSYNGKDLLFPAKLIRFGYSYRIEVDVNGVVVSFERDEERNWRALVNTALFESVRPLSADLLKAIVVSIKLTF